MLFRAGFVGEPTMSLLDLKLSGIEVVVIDLNKLLMLYSK